MPNLLSKRLPNTYTGLYASTGVEVVVVMAGLDEDGDGELLDEELEDELGGGGEGGHLA